MTFGNVGRNGNGGPSHLRGKSEAFSGGPLGSAGIHQIDKIHGALPSYQLAIASHPFSPPCLSGLLSPHVYLTDH